MSTVCTNRRKTQAIKGRLCTLQTYEWTELPYSLHKCVGVVNLVSINLIKLDNIIMFFKSSENPTKILMTDLYYEC